MLSKHSKIDTSDETWFLLPLVYSYREKGAVAEYGALSCRLSVRSLLSNLPHGEQSYLQSCAKLALDVYQALSSKKNAYFLDKTPRYHLICREIVTMFPNAKFIFLWRNPLDILSSTIDHNKSNIRSLEFSRVDFKLGASNLIHQARALGDRAICINYESLAVHPEKNMKKIMQYLELDFELEQLSDLDAVQFSRGDRNGAHFGEVSTSSIDRWRSNLATPARRKVSLQMLEYFSENDLAFQGYSKQDLEIGLSTLKVKITAQSLAELVELSAAALLRNVQFQAVRSHFGSELLY